MIGKNAVTSRTSIVADIVQWKSRAASEWRRMRAGTPGFAASRAPASAALRFRPDESIV